MKRRKKPRKNGAKYYRVVESVGVETVKAYTLHASASITTTICFCESLRVAVE